MKLSRNLFIFSSWICYLYGTIYCLSLVFIPIGIYCFVAAKRFRYKAEHIIDNFAVDKSILKNYCVFVMIVCAPFGFLTFVALNLASSNNIKVENNNFVYEKCDETSTKTSEQTSENKDESKVVSVEPQIEQSQQEKNEKFEKLQKFYEKGIITEDELEMAREQLFGKKDEN